MPGSKPGERRGGRQKGTPNKATADIKAAAQAHGPRMIELLAEIAQHGESEAARVSAISNILDRGYGKATQAVDLKASVALSHEEALAQLA